MGEVCGPSKGGGCQITHRDRIVAEACLRLRQSPSFWFWFCFLVSDKPDRADQRRRVVMKLQGLQVAQGGGPEYIMLCLSKMNGMRGKTVDAFVNCCCCL